MTNTVAIVDYGLCNLDSVRRAVEECGARAYITDQPGELARADRIILPGVGSFTEAMDNLRANRMDEALAEEVLVGGAPFLGVCLGMQLLAAVGIEGGESKGLGWVNGSVVRLQPTEPDRRVPHVGWNEVHARPGATLFRGVPDQADFYFVHSYRLEAVDGDVVAASTPYGDGFTSAVEQGNVHGVQFHPEKSQRHGFRVLTNFLEV